MTGRNEGEDVLEGEEGEEEEEDEAVFSPLDELVVEAGGQAGPAPYDVADWLGLGLGGEGGGG